MSSVSSLTNTLTTVQQKIILYVYPLWLIFGLTGCILDLIIFSRRRLRTTTCSIYFFAASADHLMTLIIGIGPTLYSLIQPDPQIQSLAFCKIRGYLFQICLMLSRWYVVFACIDRFAFTSENVRLRRFANKKIAYRVILIVIIVWSIICSHRLIFYDIKGTVCGIVNNVGAALYHSAYVIIGGGLLPVLIMITCACLIRQNLVHKQERRAHLALGQCKKKSLDHQVLEILFIQITCYIIFIIPQLCYLVFNTISINIPNRSDDRLAIEQFIAFIAECILYLFPVTSFYLYTLTSPTFRKELIRLLRSLFGLRGNNQVMSTVNHILASHLPEYHTKKIKHKEVALSNNKLSRK